MNPHQAGVSPPIAGKTAHGTGEGSGETHTPKSIPSADDFERWGLLKRNPAPDAAQGINAAAIVHLVIKADGTVLPRHLCDHQGWSFQKHGRVCWACQQTIVDFGD